MYLCGLNTVSLSIELELKIKTVFTYHDVSCQRVVEQKNDFVMWNYTYEYKKNQAVIQEIGLARNRIRQKRKRVNTHRLNVRI